MLNGSNEVLKLWTNYIADRIHDLQNKEEFYARLAQKKTEKEKGAKGEVFRKLIIPL
jgi:hypothetical protein